MDAAGHVGGDERSEILVFDHPLAFTEARDSPPVAHRHVLELAFPALIADRTVERMVDQQKLHHRLLRPRREGGRRTNLHALHDGRRARGKGFGRFLDLHQTHPAVGGNRQLAVVAKAWDVDAVAVGDLDDHRALGRFEGATVDFDVNPHFSPSSYCGRRAARALSGCTPSSHFNIVTTTCCATLSLAKLAGRASHPWLARSPGRSATGASSGSGSPFIVSQSVHPLIVAARCPRYEG